MFFKNKDDLKKFYESEMFKDLKDDCEILTEDNSHEEKEYIVKNACRQGKITLLTRNFGRGTDFHVNDKVVLENGGVCTIQTFVSKK